MDMALDATTVRGACPHDCSDNCGMLYSVAEGRVQSVRGDPDHPYTQGGLCVKVNHFEDRVHSAERVLYPLRRTGVKGAGEFARISWGEAISTIATRWKAIIAEHGPQAIMPYAYMGNAGMLNGCWSGDPFFNRLGATIAEKTFCDSGSTTAYMMTLGPAAGMDTESFRHARYIVLWACNTISTSLHHWPFIAKAQKQGAKVVVVDPVKTRTAKRADWHLALRPGTDGALALGMMNVIIAERLVDRDYVANYTTGYDELAARATEFTPERVAQITGLAAEDVRRFAREYATTQPAAIRIGVAVERHTGGGQTVRALSCLPALVGAWRQVGGGIYQLPVWPCPTRWDQVMRPDWVKPGTRVINQWQLGAALTGELPDTKAMPIRSLMVYCANPMVVAPEQERIKRGLLRDDLFTVVHEQFMTDTARYADIVLPACTVAESLEVVVSWGSFYVNYNAPAIPPLGESVPNTELFRRLARAMGFDDPFFARDDETMLRDTFDWSNPAFVAGGGLEGLKSRGWIRYVTDSADDYAPFKAGGFPTPSGKVEFKSAMAQGGNIVAPIFRNGTMEGQDGSPIDPVPRYIAPVETAPDHALAAQYPLAILSPKSHALLNSQYANLARQLYHARGQRVMIHPLDAQARGITEAMRVRVFNDRGSFEAAVELSTDTQPGLVVAPLGYWAAKNGGASVAAVNSSRFADMGRAPTFSDTRVEVAPV
jgi:anaerobic selenocysteine-containing dehydrogenase